MAFKIVNQTVIDVDGTGATQIQSAAGTDIALYPDQNIWIKEGTKLIFEGTLPDAFEAKLQATTLTADRDLILPDGDGTLATEAYVTSAVTGGALVNTDGLAEGPTNLYYTTTRANTDFDTRLATKSTTDLTEGTNLYYTTARANTDIDTRVTTSFVNALNVTAAAVQADSVALGTDTTGNYVATISGTTNEIEVTGSGTETAAVTIGLPSNVLITNDLTVGGDLFVTGTTVTVGQANLSVSDSFIYLNQGDAIGPSNTIFTGTGVDDGTLKGYFEGLTTTTYYVRIDSVGATDTFEWSKDNFATTIATGVAITGSEQALDNNISIEFTATTGHTLGDVWSGTAAPLNIDTGIFSNINTGATGVGYTHVGMFFDASASNWKLFSEYDIEPNGDIDTGDASFVLGNLQLNTLIGNVTGTVSSIANHTTTNLTEGSNLYYTDTRARTHIQGADLNLGTNKILYSNVYATAANLPAASSYHGMFAHVHDVGKAYFAHAGGWQEIVAPNTSSGLNIQFNSIGAGTAASGAVGDIRATADVTAYYSSDASLKENVINIENALDKVKQIRGVEFDWTADYIETKGGEDGYFVRKHDVGVIAQEVEAVLPEVVGTRDDGIKAVRYDRIVALLIEAIKEQQTQIDELNQRLN